MFFKSDQNLNALNAFMNRTEHLSFPDEVLQMRLQNSREIIGFIARSPEEWDRRCEFNIHYLGERFIDDLRSFSTANDGEKQINNIYTKAFRFLCEFDFLIGPDLELNFDLRAVKTAIVDDATNNESEVRSQIIYASYMMPANILKSHLNNKNLAAVSDFSAKLDEAERLRQDQDQEIIVKHESVKALDEKLDKIKTGFNFVGLYKGFAELSSKKANELNLLFYSLISMSVLILAPLVYEFFTFSVVSKET